MGDEMAQGSNGAGGPSNGSTCLNCGMPLARNFCNECGQPVHVHRTLGAFWHDLAHGILHFEGKIWHTLPLLAWRPGELTRRYIRGQRARFVSPIALFLFSVFLMFALFGMMGAPIIGIGENGNAPAEVQKLDAAIADLDDEQRRLAEAGKSTGLVDEELKTSRQTREFFAAAGGLSSNQPIFDGDLKTGWGRLDAGVDKANRNPALLLYKLQTNAYKFSWALIPISVPLVWLLFLHRRRYRTEYGAYDHLVFITYSVAFMSMLGIALVLLWAAGLGGGLLQSLLLLIPPLHMYRQLRGAYQLSRWSAIWRAFLLLIFAGAASGLFFLLLLALGVLG
ncbi:MAG: DUF3667 domain-containing protein [Pseudomonadota bacterium]|nr:DUF3667 domain-containing protein [Pseudomonadota bacterium]